jgi:hypothetical protein
MKMIKKYGLWAWSSGLLLALFLGWSQGSVAFDLAVHEKITREALQAWFGDSQLKQVIEGVLCRDKTEYIDCPVGCCSFGNQWYSTKEDLEKLGFPWIFGDETRHYWENYHPIHHFDNCAFEYGIDFLSTVCSTIVDLITGKAKQVFLHDQDVDEFTEARRTFGFLLLHAAQDFYAHSNWVELQLQQKGEDYDIWWSADEVMSLFKEGTLYSGIWKEGPFYCLGHDVPHHDKMNKDNENAPGASCPACGEPGECFFVAYNLAVRETVVWFELISDEIRDRLGDDAWRTAMEKFTGKRPD